MFGTRYRILKMLGAGGMGVVYQAWDETLGVAVALKVIRREALSDPFAAQEVERRFKRELLLARQVTHKNVVRIHDIGEVDGVKYITMPFVEGKDLSSVLVESGGRLPLGRALSVIRQVAEGLATAHEAGVVHRDLKPENVMVDADGHALIMDFGISRSVSGGGAASVTVTGAVVGTLEYMAPEQARGSPADHRADLYALGLMLYDLVGGRQRVRMSSSAMAEMMGRLEAPPPPLHTVAPEVPPAIERIVTRAVDPDPTKRYQSAPELLADLDAFEHGQRPGARRARQVPLWLAAAIVLILLISAGFAGWLLLDGGSAPSAPPDPVAVVIADLQNATGDPSFDRILEPMIRLALEDAGFISAFDRTLIGRNLGVRPPEDLNERAALQIAVKEGLGVVLSGAVERQGDAYAISLKATQAVTGEVITTVTQNASSREQVLAATTALAGSIRIALGDNRSESAQRFATQTFSATSLEVVREYAAAAEALSRARPEEALRGFSRAVALDQNFGLGHAGMAIASRNLDRQQDAEKYIREAVRHLESMTERERYRTRGLFYFITGDYPNCVKEYRDLIARYSADAPARNNLALCLTYMRDMPTAVAEMRSVIRILPRRALYRVNLALYAAYSGDFKTAQEEARSLQQPDVFGSLALAFSQLLQGQPVEAAATYESLAKIDELGASYRDSGLGDLALYQGRLSDAVRIFTQGSASDLASKDGDRAANKFAALAYTHALRGDTTAARAAAERALANSKAVKIRFLAGRVFAETGALDRARTLAAGLASELLAEPQAYARIIEGEALLKSGDARGAIKAFSEANALLDTWIGHYDLGRAYLEAGAYTQADSEFDRCVKRRGEALSLFLDEEPTFGLFPPVYYYQGRVREALNNTGSVEAYRLYLQVRGTTGEDPLLADTRRRVGE
jgi:tetratricopeptide (TPR) repeat protein